MRYRRILAFAALVFVPLLAVAVGCDGVADIRDCTRAEVEDGGCELCPVTCHNYDDAGDADASDAGDAGDSG
jgi:hypothetical protein